MDAAGFNIVKPAFCMSEENSLARTKPMRSINTYHIYHAALIAKHTTAT